MAIGCSQWQLVAVSSSRLVLVDESVGCLTQLATFCGTSTVATPVEKWYAAAAGLDGLPTSE